jgi:alpha-D-ribose 1-methylphosphonate 5-phosphate C-P lyase
MKGTFCIIDEKKFCQNEDGCEGCMIKINHTCEFCGNVSLNGVQEDINKGQVYIVCKNLDECNQRMVANHKVEINKKALIK